MKKTLALSLVASSLLFGMNVELHRGWNLVGISGVDANMNVMDKIRDKNISLIVTNDNGRWLKFDPNRSYLQQFSTFEEGKGYWIKANKDINLTFNYINNIQMPNINGGWNLVSFKDGLNAKNAIAQLNNSGFKVDLIVTNDNGRWLKFDPNRSYLQQFSTLDGSKGYWVKAEKVAAIATTKDGYNVELYTESNNPDLSNLVSVISQYNLNELPNIKDQFSGVSNIVLSTTSNGNPIESSYISPESLDNGIVSNFEQKIQNPTANQTGASLYVYGLDEGGAPFIVSNAKIYKVNSDGTKGDYLGETSQTGYLFLSDLRNGDKIWIEKDGFDPNIQTVQVINNGANYFFLTPDNGEGTYQGTQTNDNTSARLMRQLNAWNAEIYSAPRGGALITPVNSRLKFGAMLRVISRSIMSMPDYESLNSKFNNSNYNYKILDSLKIISRAPGDLMWSMNNSFDKIFEVNGDTQLSSINLILDFKLTDDINQKLLKDNGSGYDETKIDNFVKNISLYEFKDMQWTEINGSNGGIKLIIKSKDYNSLSQEEKSYFNTHPNVKAFLKIDEAHYTGAYPVVAVYKELVHQIPQVTIDNYPVVLKVQDENGSVIKNALVKMSRDNGDFVFTTNTNENGIATFNLRAVDGSMENVTFNVLEGAHYPVTKIINTSDLTKDINNTVNITMQQPPKYATVKGYVKDENNNEPMVNAKVKLIYPIALANVQKNVTKIINNKEVKGISVGSVPNATYKWYIKAHESEINQNPNSNARVSTKRWILVQKATASHNGNFLPYDKVVALALQAPLENDPNDVKIIPAGEFDIAVEVDHDIDGDGRVDFTELASTPAQEANLGGNFSSNVNNNYGRMLGYISTTINLDEIIKNAGGISIVPKLWANIDGNWNPYDYVDDNGTINNLTDYTITDAALSSSSEDYDDVVGGYDIENNMGISYDDQLGYLLVQDHTYTNGHEYNDTKWDVGISATLQGNNGNNYYVALKKVGNQYKWVQLNQNSSGHLNPVSDEDKFIFVQDDQFKGVSVNKIAQVIANNKVFAKLAMKLSNIAAEAGIDNSDLQNPDNNLVEDGFDLSVIPTITFTTNSLARAGEGKVVQIRKIIDIALGGDTTPLKKYIKLNRVEVNRPTIFNATQNVHTDSLGLYQFSAVPLSYGILNSNESLLRITSSKLGYFNSPVKNVPKFTQDDTTTSQREDVKRIDLSLHKKPLYEVDVNVTDKNGNPIDNAVVILDGIDNNNNTDLTEAQSIKAKEGSLVRFNNVIGGMGSTRIVKVSVPDSNYIPVIKTIRNLTSKKIVNIQLQSASDIADFKPRISILSINNNDNNATATVNAKIVDKEDGTTIAPENIYILNNGNLVRAVVTKVQGNNDTFNIVVPLNPGENDVVIGATNSKGMSQTNPITINYDITTGDVSGKVSGFVDSDQNGQIDDSHVVTVDVYSNDGVYLTSFMTDTNGNYEIDQLPAGDELKLQAEEINLAGMISGQNNYILAKSNLVPVTVQGGRIVSKNISMTQIQQTSISGAPQIDFIGDLNDENISADGKLNISFSVQNFDKNHGELGVVVNNSFYPISKDSLNEMPDGENSYTAQNFRVQLTPGQNIIYLVASNPNGMQDMTSDVYVNWTPSSTLGIDLNLTECNSTTSCTPYTDGAYVEVYNNNMLLSSFDENDNEIEMQNIMPNSEYTINIQPYNENYASKTINIDVNSTSVLKQVKLEKANQNIEVPDFSISGIDLNSSYLIKGKPFNAKVDVILNNDVNMSSLHYKWFYIKDENVSYQNCNSYSCEFNLSGDGQYILGVQVEDQNYTMPIYVNDVEIDMPPMPPRVEDNTLPPVD